MMPCASRRQFIAMTTAALAAPALLLPDRAQAVTKPEGWTFPEEYLPTTVSLRDKFDPGMILVDPNTRNLYWTLEKKKAIRFKVGVARGNLYIGGKFHVGAKKEWPSWTPTKEMIARDPGHYAKWADGMPGGPTNPLGARALYLFDDSGRDTFLRIHGTPEPWTIGSAVSNGCVRLTNDHIGQLYELAPIGTPVTLYSKRAQAE